MSKALSDVVRPSVSGDNPLAVEQIDLSIRALSFVRDRLPMWHRYLRADISMHIDMAQAVRGDFPALAGDAELAFAVEQGRQALMDARLSPLELQAQAATLRDAIEAFTRSAPEAVRDVLSVAIAERSKPILDAARAWNGPMGFERSPETSAELAAFLTRITDVGFTVSAGDPI
ncbi:hypothetical protein [Sphingomonas sp. ID0503]|uniref:hypothetical protein n=1 Tax=Sphingomonas sp. ID0503 TaxID=3399691 RepID=UPI003AFA7525